MPSLHELQRAFVGRDCFRRSRRARVARHRRRRAEGRSPHRHLPRQRARQLPQGARGHVSGDQAPRRRAVLRRGDRTISCAAIHRRAATSTATAADFAALSRRISSGARSRVSCRTWRASNGPWTRRGSPSDAPPFDLESLSVACRRSCIGELRFSPESVGDAGGFPVSGIAHLAGQSARCRCR